VIIDNLKRVNSRIDSIEHNQEVQLIAVSKTRSTAEIQEAVNAGQVHFGENYLQESLDKISFFKERNLIWHFIGPIQSNKTALIAENFDWVHSVDRLKIAKRLSDQRDPSLGALNILIQINIDEEQSKSGLLLNNVNEIILEVNDLPNISLRGFMCIPSPNNSANSFSEMANLISKYPFLDSLSMGMSSDLELAIERGATLVRVGADIFGQRSYN
jgi:pyridoxal phosphate enzyme (YggS family)